MSNNEAGLGSKPIMIKRREGGDEGKKEIPKLNRPPLREDPRAEAARRAAELREHRADKPAGGDAMDVRHLEPEGWTYQWHTWSIYEQRQNRNMMDSEARGWQPVPRERHPELMPKDSDMEVIIDKGCILMQIPKEIADEYRQAEIKAARDQVRWKEEAIAGSPDGTMTRDHAQAKPRISKSYEAMKIPE